MNPSSIESQHLKTGNKINVIKIKKLDFKKWLNLYEKKKKIAKYKHLRPVDITISFLIDKHVHCHDDKWKYWKKLCGI